MKRKEMHKVILLSTLSLILSLGSFAQTCDISVEFKTRRLPSCDTCSDGLFYISSNKIYQLYDISWTDSKGEEVSNSVIVDKAEAGKYYVSYKYDTCVYTDSIDFSKVENPSVTRCTFDMDFDYDYDGLCGHGAYFISMDIRNSTGTAPYTVYDMRREYSTSFPIYTEASDDYYTNTHYLDIVDDNGCILAKAQDMPRVYVLSFITTSPSCDTCTDGSIIPVIDTLIGSRDQEFIYSWKRYNDQTREYDVVGTDSLLNNVGSGRYILNFKGEHGGCGVTELIILEFDPNMSLEEKEIDNEYHLYPNPTTGSLSIEYNGERNIRTINVMGLSGSLVLQLTLNDNVIDLNTLRAKGIYLVQLLDEQSRLVAVRKVVLQ